MEQEGQYSISDILAIVRRRFWWILIPALIGPSIGLGLTYLVRPVYTSKAFVLIEQPKVPDKFVTQVITDQLDTRLTTLKEQILSRSSLEPIIKQRGLFNDGSPKFSKLSMEDKVELLRKAIDVNTLSPEGSSRVPSGFYITASADNARTAQWICSDILSMFVAENVKLRQERAENTTEFLAEQLREAKDKLDQNDAQLADFKRKYLGKLPSDEQRNLEMLNDTRTRLETLNQEIAQDQQQRIIQQSALTQMTAKKPSATQSANPSDTQKELAALQNQLAALQSRYTDAHPDVVKTKAQIRVLQAQLKASHSSAAGTAAKDDPATDSPEAAQLRMALRLTEDSIQSKHAEQVNLEQQMHELQSSLQLSPAVEEQSKALTRDYETALQFYNDLLSKKTQSEMATDLERREEGEQFGVMDAPDLPAKPSFPDKTKFSLCGLAAGMFLGIGLVLLIERRENFIRTEEDVVRILGLPVLVVLPDLEVLEPASEPEHAKV